MTKSFLLAILLIISNLCFSSKFNFRTLNVDDGISENSIYAILQDKDGFMWFGSKDGLNRYDGINVKKYRTQCDNQNTLGNNFIRSLCLISEKELWVGTDAGIYILDLHTDRFSRFEQNATNGNQITTAINAITKDKDNRIWIGTMNQGLYVYDIKKEVLIHHNSSSNGLDINSTIWTIFCDKSGNQWIGSRNGLYLHDRKTEQLSHFKEEGVEIGKNEILSITEDNFGQIWIGTWSGGLKLFNRQSQSFTHSYFCKKDSLNPYITHIRSIAEYSINELFIGSDDGLYLFNTTQNTINRIDSPYRTEGLSDQNVYSIFKDKEEGFWIGTYFGGVNYLHPNHTSIEYYPPSIFANTLNGKAVSQFCEDPMGNLWIATEDGGINYFETESKTFKDSELQKLISYHNIHALLLHDNNLLIGTFSRGLDIYNLKDKTIRNYSNNTQDSSSLLDNCIFSLYKTKAGNIYIGTPLGLQCFDMTTGKFSNINELQGHFIYDIKEDLDENIWIASYDKGAFRYTPKENKWISYSEKSGESIRDAKLISVFIDSNQNVWFTSQGNGIFKYNKEKDSFENLATINGQNIDVTYGILEDLFGNFWISTNHGIYTYNPNNLTEIKLYTKEDGLQSNEFNFKSSYKSKSGKFYFGGVNGFNAFYPEIVSQNHYAPKIKITAFKLLNNKKNIPDSLILNCINKNQKLELPYDHATFSISFVALSYLAPSKNQYAYMLEGSDQDWILFGNRNEVTYSNLSAGNYIFKVKGCNNDGVWSSDSANLQITVHPPFWLSFSAKMLYLFITIMIVILIFEFYIRKSREKNQRQLQAFKIEQEKLATKSKIDFFTTIAHEIRTPLTLIKGCLEDTLYTSTDEFSKQENLRLIDANCNQLTTLVNQLLDFRKMDAEQYILHEQPIELIKHILSIVDRFKKSFQEKGIYIEINKPDQNELWIKTDPDALDKIVSNLLSNALKFTKDIIQIKISIALKTITLQIADNGIGIPKELRDDVFKPFYQVKNNIHSHNGTGIGLYIVQYLSNSLHGWLELKETPGGGATFLFSFKPSIWEKPTCNITKSEISKEELNDIPQQIFALPHSANKQLTILIIDDNIEMCNFIARILSREYNTIVVNTSEEALENLEEHIIDIIISDIMMPGRDGVELTQIIRTNLSFSHIPIILLSAKTDNHTKSQGLDAGADVFIEKPFSPSVLVSQVNSLIDNRKKIYETFKKMPLASYELLATNKKDEKLIERLNELIDENISDVNFSVESMCEMLTLSRSNLQRKIKALSNLTPADYLRNYRLKKAYKLILENELQINEIAYKTGFSSASYFTKSFVKCFGITPSEVKAQQSEVKNSIKPI